jgi:hypothetical protein
VKTSPALKLKWRQPFLINGRAMVRKKLVALGERVRKDGDFPSSMNAARKRFRASVTEFNQLVKGS